jgi:long-chain fatty acid transport protein
MAVMERSHQLRSNIKVSAEILRPCLLLFIIFLIPAAGWAAGYQIPNQSLRAIGIAGATVAYTPGPEASYYNPANMSLLDDSWRLETSMTMLHLPSIRYTDNRSPLMDGSSDSEMFYLPQIHMVSKEFSDLRFGFSLTFPFGLAKQWSQPYPAATARKFSLDVVEMNPTFSYAVTPRLSIGGGLRLIYSEGEVKNGVPGVSRELEGDDFQFGYNLAATYVPSPPWRISATYRSEVELGLEGNADLIAVVNGVTAMGYSGQGSLDVPLPAVFSLATSYTWENLTFEIAWNRTFWSAVESFDFQYEQSFLGTPFDAFDRPLPKDWKDSDALRFGLTWEINSTWQATLGFAIDETPVKEETLGFELPDSDGYMYSAGVRYAVSDRISVGMSYMFYYTTSRSVTGDSVGGLPGINGSFEDGGAHAVNVGAVFCW